MLILDNGSEFISMALGVGLRARHRTAFHRAGKPNQNAYVESFNGRLHDECLNEHWFMSLGQARETIETWRLDYNAVRPRSALGDVPPQEFEQLALNRVTALILSSSVEQSRGAGRTIAQKSRTWTWHELTRSRSNGCDETRAYLKLKWLECPSDPHAPGEC